MTITKANLNKEIIRLAAPAVVENFLHTFLFVVDALMISRLGTVPLAAAQLSGVLFWRVGFTLACLQAGAIALVARNYGRKDLASMRLAAGNSLTLSFLLPLPVAIIGFLYPEQILALMGGDVEVVQAGKDYLLAIMSILSLDILLIIASAIMRAAGDTLTPMLIALCANALNVLLDWLLIFGIGPFPRLGLFGAGLATAISIAFAAFLSLMILLRGSFRIKLNWRNFIDLKYSVAKNILKISIPHGSEELLYSFGFLIFMWMVARLGTTVLASYTIAIRIESICFMIGEGFAYTSATIIGQLLGQVEGSGQKDLALTERAFQKCAFFAFVAMTLASLTFLIYPQAMVELFHPEKTVAAITVFCVILAAIEQPFLAITMAVSGGLRGAGDTVSPMLISFIGNVFTRIGVVYLLAYYFKLGFAGIWYGTVLDWTGRALLCFIFYKLGRWKRIKLFSLEKLEKD